MPITTINCGCFLYWQQKRTLAEAAPRRESPKTVGGTSIRACVTNLSIQILGFSKLGVKRYVVRVTHPPSLSSKAAFPALVAVSIVRKFRGRCGRVYLVHASFNIQSTISYREPTRVGVRVFLFGRDRYQECCRS